MLICCVSSSRMDGGRNQPEESFRGALKCGERVANWRPYVERKGAVALQIIKSRKAAYAGYPLSGHWLRGVDLNHRPLGYEPNELPDCSTPRIDDSNRTTERQTAGALCRRDQP